MNKKWDSRKNHQKLGRLLGWLAVKFLVWKQIQCRWKLNEYLGYGTTWFLFRVTLARLIIAGLHISGDCPVSSGGLTWAMMSASLSKMGVIFCCTRGGDWFQHALHFPRGKQAVTDDSSDCTYMGRTPRTSIDHGRTSREVWSLEVDGQSTWAMCSAYHSLRL